MLKSFLILFSSMTQFLTLLSSKYAVKHEIRQFIRIQRRTLSIAQQAYFSQQAAVRMMTYPPVKMARTIALFLSFDGEINTKPLINQLWITGKQLFLPVLHPFSSRDLLFLYYHPKSKLAANCFNILEPRFELRNLVPLSHLDVLITPLVAFDRNGNRLGMGGGFYDKTLRNWKKNQLHPVGYAYDFQGLETLPVERLDVPLPAVVTPSKIWTWENQY